MKRFSFDGSKFSAFIDRKAGQHNWLISALGLLLVIFCLFMTYNNWQAQKKIKQIENVVVAVPFELSRLINTVNIVSTAQTAYFNSGDAAHDEDRKTIWRSKISVIADSLQRMKKNLPLEDQELIIKVISALSDFEIVQEELSLNWNEIKLKSDAQERDSAIAKLNERLLIWSSITRDNLVNVLIPLQDKYQASAKAEIELVNDSINRSTTTILFSVLVALVLVVLLRLRQNSLLLSRKQAEAANAAKTEFMANVTHELRTPLNGVIGFTDLLSRTKLEDKQQKYTAIIVQSANSLLKIIDDLLSFSKMEAGKLELNLKRADLFTVAAEVTDLIRQQTAAKGLRMLLTISHKATRFVHADELRIRQVLLNLLSNAVKFTEHGEIELIVEENAQKAANGNARMSFAVRDTGIGIDPQNQQRIFEAFAQADSSNTKKFGGTGLGLTISNKLLELMGSKLSVRSQLGKGSVFSFEVEFETAQP
jgi:signal transduction histidine kinase